MGEKINVKEIVKKKKEELKNEVDKLKAKGVAPKLAVILASDDPASQIYVGKKRKMCEEMGILQEEYILDTTTTTQEIVAIIEKLNKDKSVNVILVQLPLYKHIDMDEVLDSISEKKDVDGFHPLTLGKLFIGEKETFIPCTPKGIMTILDDIGTQYVGKHAVVIGRSRIVGKPISQILLKRGATVTNSIGAHSGEEITTITCIITRPQIAKLKSIIREKDSKALMYITTVNEAVGKGFKSIV